MSIFKKLAIIITRPVRVFFCLLKHKKIKFAYNIIVKPIDYNYSLTYIYFTKTTKKRTDLRNLMRFFKQQVNYERKNPFYQSRLNSTYVTQTIQHGSYSRSFERCWCLYVQQLRDKANNIYPYLCLHSISLRC